VERGFVPGRYLAKQRNRTEAISANAGGGGGGRNSAQLDTACHRKYWDAEKRLSFGQPCEEIRKTDHKKGWVNFEGREGPKVRRSS